MPTTRRRTILIVALFSLTSLCGCRIASLAEPAPEKTATAEVVTQAETGAEAGQTVLGVLAVVPGSSGSVADPMAVAAVAASGAHTMRINLDWAISEPQPGDLSFDTLNDLRIARIEGAGLRLFPTLYVGQGWMTGDSPQGAGGGSRSYPPADLGTEWENDSGYSPGYYDFVYRFFEHYRGHFDFVAVENEAESKSFWGGTAEEYVRLLKTGYAAIKAADPAVTVVDSGFVSEALGLCIAGDRIETGQWSLDEAVEFAQLYYSAQTGRIRVRSRADLDGALNQAQAKEQCRRIRVMLEGETGSVDAINFHFYEDYRALPAVVAWLRETTSRLGYRTVLVTNEMGVRGPDIRFAESEAQAEQVFKKLVTSQTLGLEAVVWFSADTFLRGRDKVGLFGSEGISRPASQTFKLVAETLNGGYRFRATAASGPSLYHYVFEDADGLPTLEMLWTEGMAESVTLQPPGGRTQAMVVDYTGESRSLTAQDGSLKLEWVTDPILVIWR